jgi:hypothetical protein
MNTTQVASASTKVQLSAQELAIVARLFLRLLVFIPPPVDSRSSPLQVEVLQNCD